MTRKARCVGQVRFEKEDEFVAETAAQRWRRRIAIVSAIVLVVAAAGAWWLWHEGRVAAQEKATRETELAGLDAQLKAAKTAVAEAGVAPEELIRRLEALAGFERRMAALQPERFAVLLDEVRKTEQRIADTRTHLARRRSTEAEDAARERFAAGDAESGTARLDEALKLQREVNAGETGEGRNFDRELRLQRELAEMTAEPLLRIVTEKSEQARVAVAAARWEEALALFREAREAQDRLNREFPRTRYSDLSGIARLDAEIAALTADGLDAQVSDRLQRARQLRASGQAEEAVKELVAAAAAQRQLNERFGKSRFVSMERLDEIETERQTLLAEEPLRLVRTKQEDARRFLRKRQIFQAQQSVREALEAMEDLRTRFPKARQRDDDARTALVFLNLRSADIAGLQDRLYDQLAPLGSGARAMLKTEVLQADFTKVLTTNPSRNPGRALPVDSVTYPEAEEFCRRLTWVLGWRVRLPTEEEMRAAALGATDEAAAIQHVNAGLTEWLASAVGRENVVASVWQGGGEIISAPRSERARTRGFRVVVEVDLARLGEE